MKIVLFANTDWYLYNFRFSLAVFLRDSGHEVLLVSPPGPYGEKLRALGLRWEAAPMDRRSLNPGTELKSILWLSSLLKRENVDIVHSFTIKCAVYGSLAARVVGVKARVNAVTGLGYVFTSGDLRAKVLRPLVRLLLRFALGGRGARLILQNPDDGTMFIGSGLVCTDLVRIIPGSGVNCDRFVPRQHFEDAESLCRPFRVLLSARLLWDKGIREYVEAARLLHKEGRDVEFLLAGAPDLGNPAAVPEHFLRDWVARGWVQWLGHVDNMPALLARVDVMVLPSYREGLPKSLIEAAASGLPLVTTDVPGCREVVTDGVDGLLVPVGDFIALAQAISRLQDEPALRSRLGAAARTKALSVFDERAVIKQTIDVYRELVPVI